MQLTRDFAFKMELGQIVIENINLKSVFFIHNGGMC